MLFQACVFVTIFLKIIPLVCFVYLKMCCLEFADWSLCASERLTFAARDPIGSFGSSGSSETHRVPNKLVDQVIFCVPYIYDILRAVSSMNNRKTIVIVYDPMIQPCVRCGCIYSILALRWWIDRVERFIDLL